MESRDTDNKLDTVSKLIRLIDYRRLPSSIQRAITGVAVAALVIGAAFSWTTLDLSLDEFDLLALTLVLITAPLPLLLSATEYRTLANGLGTLVSWRSAFEVALLGYSANLLPLPGGAILRVSTLTSESQSSAKRPAHGVLVVGLIWLAVAVLVAGIGLLMSGRTSTIWLWISAGIGLLLVSTTATSPFTPG